MHSIPTVDDVFAACAGHAPGAARRAFSLGPCRFECHAPAPGHFDVLAQFVPWGDADPDGAARHVYEIVSVVDAALLGRLSEALAGREPDAVLETFAGDCHHERHTVDEGGRAVFRETGASPELRYAILRDGRRFYLLRESAAPRLDSYAARILREVYLRHCENAGGVVVHAAGVEWRGQGYLLVGGKTAGKTSLMLTLSLGLGGAYLANDRVILLPTPDGLRMLPFPLACRVGYGTASAIPPLAVLLESAATLARQQVLVAAPGEVVDTGLAAAFGSGLKLELTPGEIVERLGVRHAHGAPLSRIVLPALGADLPSPSVEPLGHEELAAELRGQVLTPHEEKWITPWLVPRTASVPELEAYAEEMVRRIAAEVPGVRVRYGFDYWERLDDLAPLLADDAVAVE